MDICLFLLLFFGGEVISGNSFKQDSAVSTHIGHIKVLFFFPHKIQKHFFPDFKKNLANLDFLKNLGK